MMNQIILSSLKVAAFVLFAMMPLLNASGDVAWVPLDELNQFTVNMTIIFHNGMTMTKGPWKALADPSALHSSGTEDWKRAQKQFAELFDFEFEEDVLRSGRYTLDCELEKKLPMVLYTMTTAEGNNVTFRFPPSAYLEQDVEHDVSSKCITVFGRTKETHGPALVFGIPHLEYFGAVIDKANKKIGFVQPVGN